MKLKSFFADSIEEAIGQARREMGPEAMLVHSKRSSAESRHLGVYEVVCASDKETATTAPPEQKETPRAPSIDNLVREVTGVREQMERLARSLARCGGGMTMAGSAPDLAAAFNALTDAELDAALTYEIIAALNSPLETGAIRSQASRFVRVDAELGHPQSTQKIAALVGPPGAGKTSALIKLAVRYGISAHKRVQLLTLDTYRIAAAEELQAYAAILGIGCRVVDNIDNLEQSLAEFHQADLILIDTPGLSRNEMDEDLAQALNKVTELDTHLVLAASMRSRDLGRAAEQYSIFKPDKLLFTRLDETETYGPIVSTSARMNLPVSFLAGGQRIPEDITPATKDALLSLLVPSEPAQTKKFGTVAA
jgi:flagellar biosynthesis protein FlhF